MGLSNEMVKRHKVSFAPFMNPREEDIFFHRLDSRVLTCSTHKKSLWSKFEIFMESLSCNSKR